MAVSGEDIVKYMLTFKGTPYVWGGSQPGGFDCSGLMQYGFAHFGIKLPRVSYDQMKQGESINMKGLRAGDLVFFDTNPNRPGADHVGIYMGDGKMFHTPRPGKSAEVVDLTQGYYMDRFLGGRRISGVQSTGSSDSDVQTEDDYVPIKMTPEELAASYGWAYAFLQSQPGVDKIFDQAVAGSWTPEKFQAALRDSDWWKTNSNTMREAQVLKKTDPATWEASVTAARLQVQQLASKIGAAIPAGQLGKIAESVITLGLDEGGLRNILGKYVTFTKDGTAGGEAGMHMYTMKEYAYSQGVEVNEQALKNSAALVVRGLGTAEDFQNQIREQAKGAFPGYAAQLDAGQTIREIANPYTQMMADEWEMPASGIDLKNQTLRSALNGLDVDGKPAGKNLLDFQTQLRSDPRWFRTQKARDQTIDIGLNVLKDMGLIGGGN